MENMDACSGHAKENTRYTSTNVFRLGSGAAQSTQQALCALAFIISTTMYISGNHKPGYGATTDEDKQRAANFVN